MKSINQFIFEASGKPSDLKKYNKQERKETVHFRDGDIYDTHDPGYDDEFTYYDGSGNGYIKDKEGHVYDVIARDSQSDAGRIAGGSHDYYVTIKKANGKDDFHVHGYIAIMSTPHNAGCIEDIKAGYYLEDYIAKYYNSYDHGDKFKELAEKGNKEAKSFDGEKAEKKQQKNDEFYERYAKIPSNISFEVINGEFKPDLRIKSHKATSLEKEKEDKFRFKSYDKIKDDPEYKQYQEDIKRIQSEYLALVKDIFQPFLVAKINEIFKTKDISTFDGISGYFVFEHKSTSSGHGNKWKYGEIVPAVDTKKKKLVHINTAENKVVDENVEIKLADQISVFKQNMNEKTKKLFEKVAKAFKKQEGRKQTEWIANNWEEIYNKSSYGWGNHYLTKGQAKEKAKDEFLKYMRDHEFDDNKVQQKLSFSLALVQMYIEGEIDPELGPVENPLENPEPTEKKERGKDTKMSKGAKSAAYDKMKAWHEGTRKQNLSNCSDAKLKMNYQVCKELGFDKECGLIEDEAAKRNLTLESKISLEEYIMIEESHETQTEILHTEVGQILKPFGNIKNGFNRKFDQEEVDKLMTREGWDFVDKEIDKEDGKETYIWSKNDFECHIHVDPKKNRIFNYNIFS